MRSVSLNPDVGIYKAENFIFSPVEDGVAQSVEHWTANLATRLRSPVGEEPCDLICAFLHVQGCQCVTVGTLASDVAL